MLHLCHLVLAKLKAANTSAHQLLRFMALLWKLQDFDNRFLVQLCESDASRCRQNHQPRSTFLRYGLTRADTSCYAIEKKEKLHLC